MTYLNLSRLSLSELGMVDGSGLTSIEYVEVRAKIEALMYQRLEAGRRLGLVTGLWRGRLRGKQEVKLSRCGRT